MTAQFSKVTKDAAVSKATAFPVLQTSDADHRAYRDVFKRVFDVAAILACAIFVFPLIAILAALVARDGHNPFFRQRRVGRNGRVFRIWKLRTMVPDAENRLKSYLEENPDAMAEWRQTQKLKADPRVTAFGRFLRSSSLDELPQLFNVLAGDMSLVGPRPMMCDQVAIYPGTAYYSLRPGITGNWQVSERHESGFSARSRYDTAYAESVSLWTDLRILWKTIAVVARGTGC